MPRDLQTGLQEGTMKKSLTVILIVALVSLTGYAQKRNNDIDHFDRRGGEPNNASDSGGASKADKPAGRDITGFRNNVGEAGGGGRAGALGFGSSKNPEMGAPNIFEVLNDRLFKKTVELLTPSRPAETPSGPPQSGITAPAGPTGPSGAHRSEPRNHRN
jgi:hypothetical protein